MPRPRRKGQNMGYSIKHFHLVIPKRLTHSQSAKQDRLYKLNNYLMAVTLSAAEESEKTTGPGGCLGAGRRTARPHFFAEVAGCA